MSKVYTCSLKKRFDSDRTSCYNTFVMKKQSLHIITWKEENLFVAKFLELELASQGKTHNEAIKNLEEALELYLEDEDTNKLQIPSIEQVTTQTVSL
jgi:predicted RNase H-like HicB family nuclease